MECEGGTIFTNAEDVSAIIADHKFQSFMSCKGPLMNETTVGPDAANKFKVTQAELLASPWRWVIE